MHNEVKNCKNMIDSMEYMIRAYQNNETLYHLGFEDLSTEPSINRTLGRIKKNQKENHINVMLYKSTPSIYTIFDTHHRSLSMGAYSKKWSSDCDASNMIVYDPRLREWGISIQSKSNDFTVKINDLTNVRVWYIDISDEAAIFQLSLVEPDFIDYLFDIARDAHKLININDDINKIRLESDMPIVDLEICNLKELDKE